MVQNGFAFLLGFEVHDDGWRELVSNMFYNRVSVRTCFLVSGTKCVCNGKSKKKKSRAKDEAYRFCFKVFLFVVETWGDDRGLWIF